MPPEFLEDTPDLLLRLLAFFAALLVIWLAKRVLATMFYRMLRRLLGSVNTAVEQAIQDTISIPVNLLTMVLGLAIFAQLITLGPSASLFVGRLLRTLILMAAFTALYKLIGLLVRSATMLNAITGWQMEEQLVPFIRTGLRLIILALALIAIVQEWGYDVGSLIAGLGLGGLAFALAAQDTIGNLFGFTTIVGDRPFAVGDLVRTNDLEGIVQHVGLRSTRILREGRETVTIPNGMLAASIIGRRRRRYVKLTLGVTYSTTADQMEALLDELREMLHARHHVVKDTITVRFMDFGDSALEILIYCEITLSAWPGYLQEREAINLAIMRILAGHGISVAFPSRSIYLESVPPAARGLAAPDSQE
jgi:MscS family membrane protein